MLCSLEVALFGIGRGGDLVGLVFCLALFGLLLLLVELNWLSFISSNVHACGLVDYRYAMACGVNFREGACSYLCFFFSLYVLFPQLFVSFVYLDGWARGSDCGLKYRNIITLIDRSCGISVRGGAVTVSS